MIAGRRRDGNAATPRPGATLLDVDPSRNDRRLAPTPRPSEGREPSAGSIGGCQQKV
jgi:hypothetical protein